METLHTLILVFAGGAAGLALLFAGRALQAYARRVINLPKETKMAAEVVKFLANHPEVAEVSNVTATCDSVGRVWVKADIKSACGNPGYAAMKLGPQLEEAVCDKFVDVGRVMICGI